MATESLPESICDGRFNGLLELGPMFSADQGVLPVGGPSACHASPAFAVVAGAVVVDAAGGEAGTGFAAGRMGVRGPRGLVPSGASAAAPKGGRIGFVLTALLVAADRSTCV